MGEPCRHFAKGNCAFGSACRYLHVAPSQPSRSSASASSKGGGRGAPPSVPPPPPPGGAATSNVCRFFLQGGCAYGDACRFEHPKPAAKPAPAPFPPVAPGGGYSTSGPEEFGSAQSPWPESAAAGRPQFVGFATGPSLPHQEIPEDILKCWSNELPSTAQQPAAAKPMPAQAASAPGGPCVAIPVMPMFMPMAMPMQPMQPNGHMQPMQPAPQMLQQQLQQQLPPQQHLRQQQPEKPQWDAFELDDAECGICFESIRKRGERFGMLEHCDHAFCLSCIRSWRKQREQQDRNNLRLCPICRNESFFVIPCDTLLLDPKVKGENVSKYKEEMARIPCKLFDYGRGNCAFGSSCFYAHLNPDGTRYIPPRPRWMAGANGNLVKGDVKLSDFFS
eukprot:TRINITY_DN13024_c0_g1_i1.p1 TRINITY_DN13024_c0_g1~~TRINITY_DN13024_c0_g1_i1.p1  ORF type:complete len:391 (+),score=81.75 TRINITY_DN13024_c0_g1_i1:147-1319(+)